MISTCTRGVDLGAHNPPALLIDEHRSPPRRLNLFSTSICCIVSNSGAWLQWWNSGARGWQVGDLTSSILILWLFTIQSNIYIPLLINRLDLNCDEMYRSQPLAGNPDTQSDWLQLSDLLTKFSEVIITPQSQTPPIFSPSTETLEHNKFPCFEMVQLSSMVRSNVSTQG